MEKAATQKEKNRLREGMRALRARIPLNEKKVASEKIHQQLFQLPIFKQARGVHCYVSIKEEVETQPIFKACWEEGKKTFVPFQIPDEGRLGVAKIDPGVDLQTGPFGIPEPPLEARGAVNLEEIDLVVVPGLAFDRAGNRLGFGKGFYDFFLTEIVSILERSKNSNHTTANEPGIIALAFGLQIADIIPIDPWDFKMKIIITENEIINLNDNV